MNADTTIIPQILYFIVSWFWNWIAGRITTVGQQGVASGLHFSYRWYNLTAGLLTTLNDAYSSGRGMTGDSVFSRRPCCAVLWPWEERHGRSMAWVRHDKCESDTAALCKSNGERHILNP